MIDAKVFNEDAKTNQLREDIKISTTNIEYQELRSLAYRAGFNNAGELISSFIGDLTGWLHTNGSDERDCADRWYERAFGCWRFYFKYFLFDRGYVFNEMKEFFDDKDFFKSVYDEYKEEAVIQGFKDENIESQEECFDVLGKIIAEGKFA